ncbi:MAG: DNA-directed RNA polymerase beta subunit [uncultured Thermomicrobiales bacterium]|uniref:DNA-directed RNA polymerase subunit beta n=1 Tax=uncultured Thermomicrobiales bacterium TaxID=1645740 RepID=A0A6J4UI08_9BACT|nr:MAG: DNA-directed RNA polymerase beta subunit [uncultured Thermomicrobiales bacterium]
MVTATTRTRAIDEATEARQRRVISNQGVNRRSFSRIPTVWEMPNLVQVQIESFNWFLAEGLKELLDEISPISDHHKKMELTFLDSRFDPAWTRLPKGEEQERAKVDPRIAEAYCRERDITYAAPLRIWARLVMRETGEIKETGPDGIFLGDFPIMTSDGTFIINGAERVVVSQLVRSPGVYFERTPDAATGKLLSTAKLIPNRGAWLEFETSNRDVLSVKVDRKRKMPVTILLRAIGIETDEQLLEAFADVDNNPDRRFIATTLDKEPTKSREEALIELYRRLRPGDPPTRDNATSLLENLFFNERRYDLARVGRYKLNGRLHRNGGSGEESSTSRILTQDDLVSIIREMIRLCNGQSEPDDIDHLGNRRVRAVGELIQMHVRTGFQRLERGIRERMTIQDPETVTPNGLISTTRPVMAAVREFFGGSQLSQFMDQTNPLAELTHKRRLSALGPGGLSRDRAGFDVRDVHPSHYGRICPIETPEGPNIGLIGSLATYGKINQYGFIETPYRRIVSQLLVDDPVLPLVGQALRDDVIHPGSGETIVSAGTEITEEVAETIRGAGVTTIRIKPVASEIIDYLSADREESVMIAQANTPLEESGRLIPEQVTVRISGGHRFPVVPAEQVAYMDVSPKQVVSVATALIPFLEHDDANRALMGANMQRQAVPLLRPRAPIIGTGVEHQAARDSGQVMVSRHDGVATAVSGHQITIRDDEGDEHVYNLRKFVRSNQDTCINQRPSVRQGERVEAGKIIADSSSTENGELALGQNVLVAFMPWEGGNFEDAILLSERLVRDDVFTSVHIEKYETEARDTKLGPEEITRDIPNVGEESLANLDENGIIRIGADVNPNDILVGKVTPRGETELSAEERLLRAIFGEKAREVKDTSLRVPHGVHGKIIDVKQFRRDDNSDHELPAGVNEMVRVSIAQKRKISEGDKMAGRHGNKGVISRILPIEDMPYLPDGQPIDIILNPIGVPSRMNLGQVLETHLGWAASRLGFRVATPVFDGAQEEEIWNALGEAGLPRDGKVDLYDGRTGEKFDRPVTVGMIYMLKLAHLVEDKIHARSTGPYSLVTQQPLGGKAQFGGQRFGEMEVWALEAYGAAYTLQEMLTVKSDDTVGRVKTYEAIVKGEEIVEAGVPESFKVLVKELRSLGLSIDVINEDEQTVDFTEDTSRDLLSNLDRINLSGFERTVD